jgi:hypothetical protein
MGGTVNEFEMAGQGSPLLDTDFDFLAMRGSLAIKAASGLFRDFDGNDFFRFWGLFDFRGCEAVAVLSGDI